MKKQHQKSSGLVKKASSHQETVGDKLLQDIRYLIESAKLRLAQTANAALVILYWNIGKRIRKDILKNGRITVNRFLRHGRNN